MLYQRDITIKRFFLRTLLLLRPVLKILAGYFFARFSRVSLISHLLYISEKCEKVSKKYTLSLLVELRGLIFTSDEFFLEQRM